MSEKFWQWEYHPDFSDWRHVIALRDNERDVLLCTGDGERSWGEVSADAQALIKAAPLLLEALRPLAAAASDDPGTSDLYNDQPVTLTLGDVRRAWIAIARAEGR